MYVYISAWSFVRKDVKKRPLSRAAVPQTIKNPIELQRKALAGRTALAAAFISHTLPIGSAHLFAPSFTIPSVCICPVPILSILLVICALFFGRHFIIAYIIGNTMHIAAATAYSAKIIPKSIFSFRFILSRCDRDIVETLSREIPMCQQLQTRRPCSVPAGTFRCA